MLSSSNPQTSENSEAWTALVTGSRCSALLGESLISSVGRSSSSVPWCFEKKNKKEDHRGLAQQDAETLGTHDLINRLCKAAGLHLITGMWTY